MMTDLQKCLLFFAALTKIFLNVSATNNKRFPDNFMFGVATSAYQTEAVALDKKKVSNNIRDYLEHIEDYFIDLEGSWNVDGKSESIFDFSTHNFPNFTIDNSTGDVACDSYNRWQDDITILKELGVHHFRFSIPWTRILPTGLDDDVNQKAVAHYKTIIAALKENNIEPMVTMFHWDTPQTLHTLGGPLNSSFADWFANYAFVLFKTFGDDVKYWFTINEPDIYCNEYGNAIHSSGHLDYVCTHNILKAHSKAYRIYNKVFRSKQNGKVSIALTSQFFIPNTTSPKDKKAAEQAFHFKLGWYANPVYLGDYPEIMKNRIAAFSAAEGRNKSRLPEFTDAEKEELKGSSDFFAINTYSGYLVAPQADSSVLNLPTKVKDIGVKFMELTENEDTVAKNIMVAPYGMRVLLNWIKHTYGNPEILVAKNGYCDNDGLNDHKRVAYLRDYMSYTRDAMDQDGVKVFGYTVWSLLDNFEWISGYTKKFGLYAVDFNSENKTRTPKKSAFYFQKVCRTRCLVDDCVE